MTSVLQLVNGIPRMQTLVETIYDEITNIVGTISAGTSITLPNSGTYTDTDLKVFLNGQILVHVVDFNYVGTAPRTQIQMTFDLVAGDQLRFKKGD